MLSVESIDAYYGDVQALFSASIEVLNGEIVAVIGANGAGKTTLLRSISGLIHPQKGRIEFLEERIDRLSPDKIVNRGIIQVPEGRRIFPGLTVLENLLVAGSIRCKHKTEIHSNLDRVYRLFPFMKQRTKQLGWSLSGGEQQMLALARGLMAQPTLLLLDEPSLGLAPVIVENLFNAIQTIHDEGVTLILVEQNAHLALEIADRAYVFETGNVVMTGNASSLRENKMVIEAYLGG